MNNKFKQIIIFSIGMSLLFLNLKAFSVPISSDVDIEDLTNKVYTSVVKVEVENGLRKVATGVVIKEGGYIVTTALISPNSEEIWIVDSRRKKSKAELLGIDPVTHLALIKAEDEKLFPLKIGDMKDIAPGSWIGIISMSPENKPAVTQGIVSSISQDSIRLNAWVVPGVSGSPVVNNQGHMIGLLRGVYSETQPLLFRFGEKEVKGSGYIYNKAVAPSSGMAQAIPVSVVKKIASEIREKGKVQRGQLGIYIGKNEDDQVEIRDVEENSPADEAGLKKGDVVLEFEGKTINSTEMLAHEIRMRKPGDKVNIRIKRNDKEMNVMVKLGEYSKKDSFKELELKFPEFFSPEKFDWRFDQPHSLKRYFSKSRNYIGVYLKELNRELAEYFGVNKGTGLLITKIVKDSPAQKAGLHVGDVIITADGERIEKMTRFIELIQNKKEKESIELGILRGRKEKTIEVEIEEEKGISRGFEFSFSKGKDGIDLYYGNSENWSQRMKYWFDDNYEQRINEFMDRFKEYMKNLKVSWKNIINRKNDEKIQFMNSNAFVQFTKV
ncbi:MAG: PDZ domain-containing protein [Candidatus Aminicenantaceae bacterium]